MPYKLSLKLRNSVIFVTMYITLVLVLAGMLHFLFINTFKKLEFDRMSKNIARIEKAFEKEKESINTLANDWAIWDDAYDFMKADKTVYQHFIDSNISDATLIDLKLNLMIFFDLDGTVLFSKTYYHEKPLVDQTEVTNFISENVVHKLYKNDRRAATNFIQIEGMKYLISVAPILKSNKRGVSRGFFVIGKIIDDNYITKISNQTLLPIEMIENIPPERITLKDGSISQYLTINSLFKENFIILKTSSKATFLTEGKQFLITTLLSSIILLIIFFKLTHALVNKGIINRILELQEEMKKIPLSSNSIKLSEDDNGDEVSNLKISINTLLEKTQKKDQELLQASKLATVGTMVSSFAHEINNPVFALKGSFQLIKLKLERNQSKECIELIADQLKSAEIGLERLSHIVGSLTGFVRANHGEKDRIDVHENIEKCLVLLNHVLKTSDVTLIKSFSAENPIIFANAGQFQQAITNLLTNAKDALKDRESATIELITKNIEGKISIEVIDNGHGIEDTAQIFQTFYTTKPKGQGTGLGLGVVEQVISSIDGTIDVKSTVGQGTTFTLTIPNSQIKVEQ